MAFMKMSRDTVVNRQGLIVTCFAALLLLLSTVAHALEPPTPGEVALLKQTGVFEARLKQAKAFGNHLIDPALLEQAIYKAKREALFQQGINPDDVLPAPPPAWKLMPTKGNPKIFVLLIDFLDYPAYGTREQIHSALFGDGSLISTNAYPYESLTNYYKRSSYGQLDFSGGVTLGWYHAPYNRSAVPQTTAGRENLIKEAIASFKAQDPALDFSQFNNDASDNKIELFMVIWTGPNNGWANFWWAYQTGWSDSSYTVDGVTLGKYIWQWEGYYGAYGPHEPRVSIHETGHGLGLPDYYDYDGTVGPKGGVGRLDMMDGNWGDHNSFSKWVLEWLTPTVVAAGSQTLTLNPSGNSQDAVVIMPGATSSDAFREFFVAQNRYRVGNDPVDYPTDGMLLWHVDARLNSSGTSYQYDNSYTSHKLLKLMQADGLNRIESSSATADAAMYYKPGKNLTPVSSPNSRDYLGVDSRVNVTAIAQAGQQMTATFSIDEPSILATLTVSKAGNGSGTITGNNAAEIACGNDCAESYLPSNGAVVTLTAVAAPGSRFVGWSGGGCSGTGACTVAMTADAAVTATFATTMVLSEDFSRMTLPTGWTKIITSGSGNWWFTYPEYNNTGGAGGCALGATSGIGPYNSELRTPALNLSAYTSAGLEFKTSLESMRAIQDVDVSINSSAGPWTNVWRKTGTFLGPQTVNIDLSSVAAGKSNVMLRFHHTDSYNYDLWWVIDDVKVMALSSAVATSATSVSSNLNPSTFGQSVTFTATVTPATATGSVTFKDGVTTLGTGALSGGNATYSTSALAVGDHGITAVYGGDSGTGLSTSDVLTQSVGKGNSIITITGSSSFTYNGLPQGPDTATVTGSTGAVSYIYSGTGATAYDPSSVKPTGAGTYNVIATVASDANYNGASSSSSAFTIGRATLTVSAIGVNKTYDGTVSAAVTLSDNHVGTDVVTTTYSTASFVDKNAGNGKAVSVSGISITGGAASGNYVLGNATATATADILARAVTVTADSKSKIFGAVDPSLTYQVSTGSLVTGDSFSGALNRVAGENVGAYAILQGTLTLSANYHLSYSGANLTITPAPQTITFGPLADRYLGDADFTVSATGGGSGNPVTFSSQTSSTCTASGVNGATIHLVAAGTCTVRASQSGTSNYTAANPVEQSFTVAVRPTYTVSASVSGAYGSVSPTSQSVTSGGTASITITPNNGYKIATITDNGVTITNLASPYVITAVTADHTVVVSFSAITGAPVITGFTPASGLTGSSVTIKGTNLGSAVAVMFNGVSAVVTKNTTTSITATVPVGATSGPISVTTATGTATSTGSYTVLPPKPTVIAFSPLSGIIGGTVIVTGTNFLGATAVKFNATSTTTFTIDSANQITVVIPDGATTGKISVITPGGTGVSAASFKVIGPPTITSFTPVSGLVGTLVSIRGTNLGSATSVKFNGVAATIVSNSSTGISAKVPAGATTGPVSVTTAAGTAISTAIFTVK